MTEEGTTNIEKILNFKLSRKLVCLIKLSLYQKIKSKEPFTLSELERYLGFNSPQPDLRRIFEFLIDNNIITEYDKYFHYTRYKLDTKKLVAFIDKLEFIQIAFTYFDEHHLCEF